jgi:hypothetical protein
MQQRTTHFVDGFAVEPVGKGMLHCLVDEELEDDQRRDGPVQDDLNSRIASRLWHDLSYAAG